MNPNLCWSGSGQFDLANALVSVLVDTFQTNRQLDPRDYLKTSARNDKMDVNHKRY